MCMCVCVSECIYVTSCLFCFLLATCMIQLPYFIDGDLKLTQSNAVRYDWYLLMLTQCT